MAKNHLLILLLVGLGFTGCKSSKESTGSTGVWVNKEKIQGKQFHKIFIVVVTADILARTQLENDLAAVATARGYEAVKSMDLLPISLDNPKKPTKEEVVAKVKESGCDAVFVASLLNKDESIRYVPGKSSYSMLPYYSYTGTYYGYYNNTYETVVQPSYYAHDKNYFMQSNLYDVASEELMWSVQSELFNPSDIQKFSKGYTTSLIKELEKIKLMKK